MSRENLRLSTGEEFIHNNYLKVKFGDMTFDELVKGSELCDTKVRSYIREARIPLEFKDLQHLKDHEKKFIRDNYEEMNYSKMARELGRSTTCVRDYCINELKVEAKSHIIMDDKAIEELQENGPSLTAKEWSEYFEVDITRIYEICRDFGIEYKKAKKDLCEEEIAYIEESCINMSPKELSKGLKELGFERSHATIRSYLIRNNLEVRKSKKVKKDKKDKKDKNIKEDSRNLKVKDEILNEVAILKEDDSNSGKCGLLDILDKYVGKELRELLIDVKGRLSVEVVGLLNNSNYDEACNLAQDIKIIGEYISRG